MCDVYDPKALSSPLSFYLPSTAYIYGLDKTYGRTPGRSASTRTLSITPRRGARAIKSPGEFRFSIRHAAR